MTKPYNVIVYIGRFEPPTRAHIENIRQGAEQADLLIVLIGSSEKARDPKNPFTYEERARMIMDGLKTDVPSISQGAVVCEPLRDHMYNDSAWIAEVQSKVMFYASPTDRIALLGHVKDESSWYLQEFPQWGFVEVPSVPNVNATDVRDIYFQESTQALSEWNRARIAKVVPAGALAFLDEFRGTETFQTLHTETLFVQKYKKAWEAAPYAPTFVTADAVVIQSGHILLVERGAAPGRGLLALPGGFINPHERVVDAAVRELREETKLKVPAPVLKGSITGSHVFDHPYRSLRGRTITHAFMFELAPGPLPKVKGSDDAKHAFWKPLSEIVDAESQMFEDHFHIIKKMVGMD